MNNSLYKATLYLYLAIFVSGCSSSLFERSEPETQDPVNSIPVVKLEKNRSEITKINKPEILSEQRIDNIFNTSTENVQEIALLKSKVKYLEQELKNKSDATSIFNNPYALFNQQIIMDNGTIYYGSIIFQDEQFVTIETLIGKLNLERTRIRRVLSHHLDEEDIPAFPEVYFEENITIEDGDILYKSPANIVLANNINTTLDDNGNTVLSGQLQNIGGKRADFVKIHMTLYRDWSQTLEPKTFTVFVTGSTHYFDEEDSTKISDSSIGPKARADFSLTIPRSFGNVMSWKYDIAFEAY